jgi:alpha,alpha-trehalase
MATPSNNTPRASEDYGVYDDAKTYYASEERHQDRYARTRTYSQVSRHCSETRILPRNQSSRSC